MDKKTYFLNSIRSNNHHKLDWVVSCFSVTIGEPISAYNYSLTQTPTGSYANVDDSGPVLITDAQAGKPLFSQNEPVMLKKGDVVNLKQDITTTYDRLLANLILLVEPFGDKIEYINKEFAIPDIEQVIEKSFSNDPADPKDRKNDTIYVSEYLKFTQSCYYLTGFTQLFTWAGTEKNILPPPGIKEFKATLLEQYKDSLSDPVVIAKIEKELIDYDAKWRKGDPGNRYLISKKSVALTRKQKVLMYGAESISSASGGPLELHENSLYEGWEDKSFTAMCTTARYKSYARGAETALGGVEVKWLLRASGNINVTIDDCKSNLGVIRKIDNHTAKSLVGFSIITSTGSKRVNSQEEYGTYMGKYVMVRSPMYCNLPHTDYCKICVGPKLSSTPYALSSAVSAYGSAFLLNSLGAAHSKAIDVAELDLETDLL